MAATNERPHDLKARGIEEVKRFGIMFVYLWVIFGLFSLNQAVINHNLSYLTHGFAVINAAVFAKIMLVAEDLKLGNRFQTRPLLYPVLYKTILFSIMFILVHIAEEAIMALWRGKPVAQIFPDLSGSEFVGAVCVWGILTISLLPFFTIREIARVMGEHELWNLFFRHRAQGHDDPN